MNHIALFAALLCLGLMVAPGLAQQAGFGDLAETIDTTENADAHVQLECLKGPCICYWDSSGYHCHAG